MLIRGRRIIDYVSNDGKVMWLPPYTVWQKIDRVVSIVWWWLDTLSQQKQGVSIKHYSIIGLSDFWDIVEDNNPGKSLPIV